jgi:hypothetical protein
VQAKEAKVTGHCILKIHLHEFGCSGNDIYSYHFLVSANVSLPANWREIKHSTVKTYVM